jgi:hypothetical protein
MNINRYSPDTCGCVIHYTWDDDPNVLTPFVEAEIPLLKRKGR